MRQQLNEGFFRGEITSSMLVCWIIWPFLTFTSGFYKGQNLHLKRGNAERIAECDDDPGYITSLENASIYAERFQGDY